MFMTSNKIFAPNPKMDPTPKGTADLPSALQQLEHDPSNLGLEII
jgi:hypothetical protein